MAPLPYQHFVDEKVPLRDLESKNMNSEIIIIGKKPKSLFRRVCHALAVSLLLWSFLCFTVYVTAKTDRGGDVPRSVSTVKKAKLCESPACVVAAAAILENMAPAEAKVDPCTNFDDFVCAGWKSSHDLRPDQGDLFEGTLMSERSLQLLRHVIEDSYPDASAHSSFSPSLLKKDKSETDRANFQKIKDTYNACMDEKAITDLRGKPLIELLNAVGELFPVEHEENVETEKQPVQKNGGLDGMTAAFIYLSELGVSPLVTLSIGADDKKPDSMSMTIFNPWRIGLPSKEYYLNSKVVQEYTTALADFINIILAEKNSTVHSWSNLKTAEVMEMAKNIVAFETEIAAKSMDPEDMFDVTKTYNPMALSEAQALLPQLSFETIFSRLSPEYTPEIVLVASPSYLKDLSKLLETTEPDTVKGYFLFKAADAYSHYVSDDINKPLREFKNKLLGKEPSSKTERWKTCVNEVDESLGWISGRFFIEKAFSEDAKKLGDKIILDIKQEFIHKLKKLDWVSDGVKKLAINKVHQIIQKIGYPTKSPDITSPSELQKFYDDVEVSNSTFFQNAVSSTKSEVRKSWKSLKEPTNRDEWGMTPPTVNAYYNPPGNEIVFPAGIMQRPVFGVELPGYINYGAFGSISGHELSHAFDSTGRHYDENGNYVDWWDNTTVHNFQDKAKCFIDQYSKFSVEGPDGKPLYVNGNLTLGENIADAGGVNSAFGAWKRHEKKKPDLLLPGLHKRFTKEQLFFISYGTFWCGKTRKETAINRIFTDPHSPKFARISGTMANSKDFLKAFKCPAKKVECELW